MKEDKIKPLALSLFHSRKRKEQLAAQMKELWTVHFLDILELSKYKETAKVQNLSNETGREIALNARLNEEPEYQRLKTAHDAVSTEIEMTLIELEHERNAFKVWYVEELKKANGVT